MILQVSGQTSMIKLPINSYSCKTTLGLHCLYYQLRINNTTSSYLRPLQNHEWKNSWHKLHSNGIAGFVPRLLKPWNFYRRVSVNNFTNCGDSSEWYASFYIVFHFFQYKGIHHLMTFKTFDCIIIYRNPDVDRNWTFLEKFSNFCFGSHGNKSAVPFWMPPLAKAIIIH